MMKLRKMPTYAMLTFVMFLTASRARAAIDIDWYTIDGGGITFATDGGSLEVGGTVGQGDVGTASDGSGKTIEGGFWFSVAPPGLTVPGNITIGCSDSTDPSNTGQATATSDCDSAATLAYSDSTTVGSCPQSYTITRTWTATEACGNATSGMQTITVQDMTPPTFNSFCPLATISANADAGSCSASAATVNATEPGATDACSGAAGVVGSRSDLQPMTAPYPAGTTTITWTATDACGNPAQCQQDVFVSSFNEMILDLQLAGAAFPASLTRCIAFELYDCNTGKTAEVSQPITFSSGLATSVAMLVPCSVDAVPVSYTCITARDRLHTLRRTDADDFGTSPIVGTQYRSRFSDRTGFGGDDDSLIGGNLNDDFYIDILDYAIFANQYLANYGTGDTTCSTAAPHADISGNGTVFTEDFTFIQINFLKTSEVNCCGAPGLAALPRLAEISVADLQMRGLGELLRADLNGDGVVDQRDMALFAQRLTELGDGQPGTATEGSNVGAR